MKVQHTLLTNHDFQSNNLLKLQMNISEQEPAMVNLHRLELSYTLINCVGVASRLTAIS